MHVPPAPTYYRPGTKSFLIAIHCAMSIFTPRTLRSQHSEEEYMTSVYIDDRPTTVVASSKISNEHHLCKGSFQPLRVWF